MRSQFVLDAETDRLLGELAESRAGNRSYVVREAIRFFGEMEALLDRAEAGAEFRRIMERSAADIEAGRVHNSRELRQQLTARRRRGPADAR